MKKTIYTKSAPNPVGPYCQATVVNGFLYCSGQIGINPQTNSLVEGIENQSEQVMKNIKALLDEADYNFSDVVKTTCFLSDMNNFSKFNDIYAKHFVSNPARSCVEAKLPKGALVEVEIIAHKESEA